MTITEKIDHIIDRRIGRNDFQGKGHLEIIRSKQTFFMDLLSLVEEYNLLRTRILKQISEGKGEYYTMSVEDLIFQQKVESSDPSALILQLQKCLKECDRLEKRFNRDTINISVVGRAGQGKSRLLQSISGVPNDIIPADTGGDCTGAKSTIANAKGQMHAKIKFCTEQEIVVQVQAYLDALNSDIIIGNIGEVPHINLDQIKTKCGRMTSTQDSLFRHLANYINHYDVYAPELGGERDERDPQKIRYYVAQYATGNSKDRFYAYLGVKEVTIFTEFPEVDAGKILLVDTIGLGDTSLNLEAKMMETLGNDSDAAIVVRKADPEREHVSNEDNDFYDYLVRSLGNRDIEKWLFYALNVCDALHNTTTGEELFDRFNEKRKDGSLRVALLEKVDCGDQQDVRNKLLLPMLDFISKNLIDIDNSMMTLANKEFSDAFQKYFDLCATIGNILNSKFKQSLKVGGLFDSLYKQLHFGHRMKELCDKYDVYRNGNEKCNELQNEVAKVLLTIKDVCPTSEDLINRLSAGAKGASPSAVFNDAVDYTRAAIIDKFESINTTTIQLLQIKMKCEVIEILMSDDGAKLNHLPVIMDDTAVNEATETMQDFIKKGEITKEHIVKIEWLRTFIEQKLNEYPLLSDCFKRILNFKLGIEGSLQHYVRKSLQTMDTENPMFHLPSFNMEPKLDANIIRKEILLSMPVIARQLSEDIDKFVLQIPNEAFHTEVRKLRDRLFYNDEYMSELKELYRDNATYVWNDDFKAIAGKQEVVESLSTLSSRMMKQRNKSLFSIQI